MKKLFVLICTLFVVAASFSQTVNYALENTDGTGNVKALTIFELNESPEATFQMWVKPTEWTPAKLLSQDNFSIEFGKQNTIVLKSGDQSAVITASELLNRWSQLTITVTNGLVKAYINNNEVTVNGSIPAIIPASAAKAKETICIIAQGLKGQIDEIRVWNRALEQKDFFWRNTLNKHNSNYDALVAYWKCDQDQCENLVDYKFIHHGIMNNMIRKSVTDNSDFKYRVVCGYTPNFIRFIDRPNINRDMFLMTNDVIFLSGKVQKDGSIFPEYPDNSAIHTNVDYVAEFEGRKGVMAFHGADSKMESPEGRIFFNPNDKFYTESNLGSIAGWIYMDKWEEGSIIFSKYQDADNCITVKLGSEEDKSVIVDFCGFIATLKGKLEVGKWQYLGVYLAPKVAAITNKRLSATIVKISIDYQIHTGTSGIELSGKDMTISLIPKMETTPIVIGKGFNGKIDELMVWGGMDRSGSAQNDAENGYQWNVGNWNNLFLNAFWMGDDPDNLGKDSQSYTGMMDFVRNYYKGYRGFKIRIGIIYPDGDNWRTVLNQKENVDRLIRDAKIILEHCDGLDIDLEWKYYDVFNPVVRRIIDEVMPAASRGNKVFTISQHQYSYELDKNLIPDVDYFTMQLYGPQTATYTWDYYTNAYQSFLNYGYPSDKLLLSYGVLLVNGSTEQGYKDLFEKMGINDDNYDPNLNVYNGWYFNGVNQTKKKQEFILDNDCLGTMYFDMANDLRVNDYKSLIRAQNEIIAANVDTLITKVDIEGTSIGVMKTVGKEKLFSFYPNPANDKIVVSLGNDDETAVCEISTLEGKLVMQTELYSMNNIVSLTGLQTGFYLIKVHQGGKEYATKLCIN